MKEIDLKELVKDYFDVVIPFDEHITIYYPALLELLKDACNQTIDLCAEEAEMNLFDFIGTSFKKFPQGNHYCINYGTYIELDKESILNLKNQIK